MQTTLCLFDEPAEIVDEHRELSVRAYRLARRSWVAKPASGASNRCPERDHLENLAHLSGHHEPPRLAGESRLALHVVRGGLHLGS